MGIPFTLPMGILLTIALAIQLTISKGTDVGPENAPGAAKTATIDRRGRDRLILQVLSAAF
jgi:hypothetical protein